MSLNHSIVTVCNRNRDGSRATQADRMKQLTQIGKELRQMGYKLQNIANLKPKHVEKLVASWQARGLAQSTMMNRMANVRWLAEKIGKVDMIKSNQDFNIGGRVNVDAAKAAAKVEGVNRGQLDQVRDPHVRMSLELQKAFNLRREEAMKIQPGWADRGDSIKLKGSWTKGGKERDIPIRNEQQRAVLERAKGVAQGGSMIPADRSYKQQMKLFERECKAAGYSGTHGARYEYAQTRYKELTGREAPANGGPARSELTGKEREKDTAARLTISKEMGHERHQITSVYLGG